MGKLLDFMTNYFKNSSTEQLEKDWDELKQYNENGPNILDVINGSKQFNFHSMIDDIRALSRTAIQNSETFKRIEKQIKDAANNGLWQTTIADSEDETLDAAIDELQRLGFYITYDRAFAEYTIGWQIIDENS